MFGRCMFEPFLRKDIETLYFHLSDKHALGTCKLSQGRSKGNVKSSIEKLSH